jgi:hypothetical protein
MRPNDPGDWFSGAANPAPSNTPPAAPGSIGVGGSGGGGGAPDWGALLAADPGYMEAMAGYKKIMAQAASQRKAALQALAMRYGGLPKQGWKDTYGDLTPEILRQAGLNENSEVMRLQRNYDTGIKQLKANLAARGMLQSGDLGYGLNQADIGKGEQTYDLGNQFTDQANQVVSGYLSAYSGAEQNLVNAILMAEQNAIASGNYPGAYGGGSTQPTQATYVPASEIQFGEPIYVDSAGNQYRQDGTPWSWSVGNWS